MKTISATKYCEGVRSIYVEQPDYQLGHDGSDGKCDCIGMVRGGSERAGAKPEGLSGTNYAARHTIEDLKKIESTSQLKMGDVVLKTRDADDKSMPLPDKYRKGGSDYSSRWGETNFTHIGTVTGVYPLEITHMTSPKPKKDTKLGSWAYVGKLPWVKEDGQEQPDEPQEWATVWAEKGSTVKLRAKPSTSCRTYWDVPIGSQVILLEPGDEWSRIRWAGQDGFMMSKFLYVKEPAEKKYTVTLQHVTREKAEELLKEYPGTMTLEGT